MAMATSMSKATSVVVGGARRMPDHHVVQGNVIRQADGVLIIGDVHLVVGREFQQPHRLSRSGERRAGRIGVAKIIALIIAARPGTGKRFARQRPGRMQQRMRRAKITQPFHIGYRQVRRLPMARFRRKKIARFLRMTVRAQRDVERLLDIRYAAFHVQHHAVGMHADHLRPLPSANFITAW